MANPIASRKRRIVALLIDTWFFGYLSSLCMYLVFFVFKTPWDAPLVQNNLQLPALIGLMSFILFNGKDAFNGAGPGKRLLGIRVVNPSGTPASASRTFLRNIPLIALPIETLAIVVSTSKRRIGDYLTNTQVKRDLNMTTANRGLTAVFLVSIYLFAPSFPNIEFSEDGLLQLSQLILKQSNAYELAEKKIYEQDAIMQIVGPIQSINIDNTSNVSIYNDQGDAQLNLNVLGKNKNLPVMVKLKRTNNEWELTEMYFEQTQNISVK